MGKDSNNTLRHLIEALQILAKYNDRAYPTHCEHDVLMVLVDPEEVSAEDKARLEQLGFDPGEESEEDCFVSFRFGSA